MKALAIGFLFVLCIFVGGRAEAIPPLLPLSCRPCTQSASCGQGQICWGSKTDLGFCLQACASDGGCPSGFRCATLAAGLKHCLPEKNCDMACNQTSECPAGYSCSQNRCLRPKGGQEGDRCDTTALCSAGLVCANDEEGASRCVSPCDPQANPTPCPAGFRCLPFGAAKFGCFREIGPQRSGERCSLFLPCEAGSECRKFAPDTPAFCYKSCLTPDPAAACQGLGRCDFIGRTGNYCFCEKDADCAQNKQCTLVEGPFQRGLCQAGDKTTCTSDGDCIEDTTCVQGRCTLPPAMEVPTEPPPESPVEGRAERSAEVLKEARPEAAETESAKEPPAEGSASDASDSPRPEISAERPRADLSVVKGSCQCQSLDPLPLSLGFGLIGLWLLGRRRALGRRPRR